ncbi:MAG TPA: 23S rRNA (pseudouridine(1915)-N(3))-methyltransferase RlmH [Devosiaceae bacterium]
MRIVTVVVGRLKNGPERELADRYTERARVTGRNLALTGFDVVELAESRASSAGTRKLEEARLIRAAVPADAVLVALDERGKALTSLELATRIGNWRDAARPALAFVIGGADGLDGSLREEAALSLSLSAMTWPHQIARIMLSEQLYRTTTILSGHPYHRGN